MNSDTKNSKPNLLPNVDGNNKRKWIHAKKPSGKFHNYRIAVTSLLLSIFLIGPWIQIKGRPLLLLNVIDRKFVILGNIFWPQDTSLLIFLLLIFFVFIITFTIAFGRVWCGWACPQTLFMEMVFRKIEYLIEGDYQQQIKLKEGPRDANYYFRKGLKHFIFILIAIIIAHTVMMYIIGARETLHVITHSPSENWAGFIALFLFSTIFYLVFSVVREVACTVICPYGRLQGALVTKETSLISYDYNRGEPRGKMKKEDTGTPKGDCVDCALCVKVCPTGIDIRNGIQMECVSCTACIDACDEVMEKIHKPKGLIRYASLQALKGKKTRFWNVRTIAYSGVLSILVAVFLALLTTRSDIETTILRVPGQLYKKTENNLYTNLYNIQVVNKTYDPLELEFRLKNSKGEIKMIGESEFRLEPQSKKDAVLIIALPTEEIKNLKTRVIIEVVHQGKVLDRVKASFIGPVKL